MTYRRRYFARPQLSLVVDLLLLEPTNTRALAFQLNALLEHVQHLPRDRKAPQPTREERLLAQANTTLEMRDLDALCRPDVDGGYPQLTERLVSIEDDLRALSDTITRFYFSHATPRVS
jgi:uncharacterized alpha-E superfamily protein